MNKAQYLGKLKAALIKGGLKRAEIEGALQYYGELIDEAVDGGESEEAVVGRLPSVKDAAQEIMGETLDNASIMGESTDSPKKDSAQKKQTSTKRWRNPFSSLALLILFAIFVAPFAIVALAAVFSLCVGFLAIIISLVACAIALPIYAIAALAMSGSAMILFVYLCVGFACLAIGLLLWKAAKPLGLALYKLLKRLFGMVAAIVRGN